MSFLRVFFPKVRLCVRLWVHQGSKFRNKEIKVVEIQQTFSKLFSPIVAKYAEVHHPK
jgi:hypothetical protein